MILGLLFSLNIVASAREAIVPGFYVGDAGAPVAFVRVHEGEIRTHALFMLAGSRPTLGRGRPVETLDAELKLTEALRFVRKGDDYFVNETRLVPVSQAEFYARVRGYLVTRGVLAMNVPFDERVEAETARIQRANEMCVQFFGLLCFQTGLRMRTGEPIELEVPRVRRAAANP